MALKRKRKIGFFENRVVVQKNDFLRGNTKYFTINDLKFLKLLISKIHLQDRKRNLFSEYYEVSADEIKHLNINEKHLRKEVIRILTKLASIYVTIDSPEGERIVGLIKNDFFFPKFQKKVRVSFNQDMEQYLLVSNSYTKYLLSDIIDFKYKHTLKLYEYMKSIDLTIIKIEYTKLRAILELTELYTRDTDFKKVIINSIKEINTKANSIKLEATFEKKSSFYFVNFLVSRYDVTFSDKLLENNQKIGFHLLIGKECLIKKKSYVLENIFYNENENIILLKEKNKALYKELEFENQVSLIDKLKLLFGENFLINSLEDISPIQNKKEKVDTKDIIEYKKYIIGKFKNSFLINDAPGFLENENLYLNDAGLITKENGVIIDQEKAFAVWKYLYENKESIGIKKTVEPIKKYIGETLEKRIKNSLFGTEDVLKYKIDDIKIEDDMKYRLYIRDESGNLEKAKNSLDYKQLVALVERKVI